MRERRKSSALPRNTWACLFGALLSGIDREITTATKAAAEAFKQMPQAQGRRKPRVTSGA
jgi:hypothetical protein